MAKVEVVTAGQGSSVDWQAVRAQYPAASDGVFLNAGSRGVMSAGTLMAIQNALAAEHAIVPPEPDFATQMVEVRLSAERLLKARAGTVGITKNTTDGLNAIANAVDWQPGDNVVVCSTIEHANNVYLWMRLSARGVEVRDIPDRAGAIDMDAVAEAIDGRTKLVTAAAVSFVPGFRTDMESIGKLCRKYDAVFLVDGVQACGIIDLDVEALNISALSTSTSKGLLGLRGMGLLYVAPEWIERLDPVYVARNSIDSGGRHYSEFEANNTTLHADARRYEWGSYNYLGISALRNSLREILELGTDVTEARATELASALSDELKALGLPVLSSNDDMASTHLVTVGERGVGDAATTGIPMLDQVAAALEEGGVRFSIRRGLIRFGFNFYNDESDVERVLEITRTVVRKG